MVEASIAATARSRAASRDGRCPSFFRAARKRTNESGLALRAYCRPRERTIVSWHFRRARDPGRFNGSLIPGLIIVYGPLSLSPDHRRLSVRLPLEKDFTFAMVIAFYRDRDITIALPGRLDTNVSVSSL